MARLKNQRHENFCRAMFSGKNQTQAAILAGYEPKYAKQHAWIIASRSDVQSRMQELNEAALSDCIMEVMERKARLSEIARTTNLTKSWGIAYGDNIRAIAELNCRMEGIGSWNKEGNVAQAFIPISEVEFRMNFPDEPSKE
jgi:phage terminase small subunit